MDSGSAARCLQLARPLTSDGGVSTPLDHRENPWLVLLHQSQRAVWWSFLKERGWSRLDRRSTPAGGLALMALRVAQTFVCPGSGVVRPCSPSSGVDGWRSRGAPVAGHSFATDRGLAWSATAAAIRGADQPRPRVLAAPGSSRGSGHRAAHYAPEVEHMFETKSPCPVCGDPQDQAMHVRRRGSLPAQQGPFATDRRPGRRHGSRLRRGSPRDHLAAGTAQERFGSSRQ